MATAARVGLMLRGLFLRPRLVSRGALQWLPLSTSIRRAAISRDPFYEMLAARKKKVSSTKRH